MPELHSFLEPPTTTPSITRMNIHKIPFKHSVYLCNSTGAKIINKRLGIPAQIKAIVQ